MPMTPEAKRALSQTVRALRARLLEDLLGATDATFRLSVDVRHAELDEAALAKRKRLDDWIAEQLRAQSNGGAKTKKSRTEDDFRKEAVKQAAYTLLNRLVLLRLMEAPGPGGEPLRAPAVVTGGWESRAYRDFRELAPALVRGDETEGYAFLLRLIFEDLATELPGLYGPAGVAELIPIPASTLRHAVDELDKPELLSCWTDDMTLGWVYQYWNDPEREALDAKLNSGGKVEPHEIASKTQMFTERYMVDWLLQNSLGPMWLAMCKRHGWTPEVEAEGTLDALEERRAQWREKRERGEVSLTELMPLHTGAERRWAYYVPQPIPDEAVEKAPKSLRDLRLLDPALGSGHFLVVAMELLFALYREEARHRGSEDDEEWSDKAIVERILTHNLHGIDLDPRAVQIAAAALWLKARQLCSEARPERMNLVASNLRLARLPDDDEALVELREEVERQTGVPGELTDTIVQALRGADHLGSLLKIDEAVQEAIRLHEERVRSERQMSLGLMERGAGGSSGKGRESVDSSPAGGGEAAASDASAGGPRSGDSAPKNGEGAPGGRSGTAEGNGDARRSVLDRIEAFLERHTSGDDLGLRLRGEQLAAGVRFVRLVREGRYDLVVANPPYQGTAKMVDAKYVEKQYKLGKADLYAAFLLRGLELVRDGGVSAMLTMRGWMFIKQFAGLREELLGAFDLRALHDLSSGAFEEISAAQVVVSVVSSIFARTRTDATALAIKAFDDATVLQVGETHRKRAATLCQVGRHEFDPAALKVVPEWPLVYFWSDEQLDVYARSTLVGQSCPARFGLTTGDNDRFCRMAWEPPLGAVCMGQRHHPWAYLVHGAKGVSWMDAGTMTIRWRFDGMEVKLKSEAQYGSVSRQIRNTEFYFRRGLAFSAIGNVFSVRAHRYPGVFSNVGLSLFPVDVPQVLAALSSTRTTRIVADIAPGIRFDVGDVNRLPLFPVGDADEIFATIESAFTIHESHREPSVEFKHPGPSPWRHAQDWAQAAVDRSEGAPLPEYIEELDPEPPTDHISFALGVALGRFAPAAPTTVPTRVHRSGTDATGEQSPEDIASEDQAAPTTVPTRVHRSGTEATGEQSAKDIASADSDAPTPVPTRVQPADAPESESAAAIESSILDPTKDDLSHALPAGILFLDCTLDSEDRRDSLGHEDAAVLHDAWATYGPAIGTRRKSLREYLALDFFKDVHRTMYENRPIHWPLSSAKRTFVAWVNIHRFDEQTLRVLLADHLQPALVRLEGELADLRAARDGADKKAARAAEKDYDRVAKARDELTSFIADVEQCADRGAPPAGADCPPREQDSRYAPDLDDGVMINSAALWPLFDPQWKDPKKWWKELAQAKGKKDYDWSHLAMQYWPTRVDEKCRKDPSLGVAHGCFWRYHPQRAWSWELRLQDEIAEDFRIEEPPYRPGGRDVGDQGDAPHRAAYLKEHPTEALATVEKEALRRMGRKGKRRLIPKMHIQEPGLWSTLPAEVWQMELRLSEKQGTEFRLLSPDEPESRAAYEAANPEQARHRPEFLAKLKPVELFAEAGDDGHDDAHNADPRDNPLDLHPATDAQPTDEGAA